MKSDLLGLSLSAFTMNSTGAGIHSIRAIPDNQKLWNIVSYYFSQNALSTLVTTTKNNNNNDSNHQTITTAKHGSSLLSLKEATTSVKYHIP